MKLTDARAQRHAAGRRKPTSSFGTTSHRLRPAGPPDLQGRSPKTFCVQYRDDRRGVAALHPRHRRRDQRRQGARPGGRRSSHAVRHGTSRTLSASSGRRLPRSVTRSSSARRSASQRALPHLPAQAKLSPRWMTSRWSDTSPRHWAPLARGSIHAIDHPTVARRLYEITAKSGEVAANHARSHVVELLRLGPGGGPLQRPIRSSTPASTRSRRATAC